MKKFVFLDFDGVLNSHSYEISEEFKRSQEGLELDPNACKRLKKALDQVKDVKIVVISAWRNQLSLKDIKVLLAPYELDKYITAMILPDPVSKSEGIENFIFKHSDSKFVILDDDMLFDLDHPFNHRQIKTSLYSGLLEDHCHSLIHRLNKK